MGDRGGGGLTRTGLRGQRGRGSRLSWGARAEQAGGDWTKWAHKFCTVEGRSREGV